MNALTISALTKFPLNSFSFAPARSCNRRNSIRLPADRWDCDAGNQSIASTQRLLFVSCCFRIEFSATRRNARARAATSAVFPAPPNSVDGRVSDQSLKV